MWVYIYTEEQEWQPWENTLAYLPLKEDVLDYSWNWNNWSWNPNSFTEWVANYSGNSTTIPYSIINRNTYTVNIWANSNFSKPSSDKCFLWQHTSSVWWFNLMYYNNNIIKYRTWSNSWSAADVNWIDYYTWWHLITAVLNSWTMYLYVDGVLQGTNTSWGSATTTMYMGYDKSNNTAWSWKLSELIVESVAWTAEEILAYYNLTKSIYWL